MPWLRCAVSGVVAGPASTPPQPWPRTSGHLSFCSLSSPSHFLFLPLPCTSSSVVCTVDWVELKSVFAAFDSGMHVMAKSGGDWWGSGDGPPRAWAAVRGGTGRTGGCAQAPGAVARWQGYSPKALPCLPESRSNALPGYMAQRVTRQPSPRCYKPHFGWADIYGEGSSCEGVATVLRDSS